MAAGSQAIVIALIVALATGAPALAYTIFRGKRMGPREEADLIASASEKAVQTMDRVLAAAAQERAALLRKVATLEERDREKGRRIAQLEGEGRKRAQRISELDGAIARLTIELAERPASG